MALGKGRGENERARSRSPAKDSLCSPCEPMQHTEFAGDLQPKAAGVDLRKGSGVRLGGLKGAAHLNGMAGVCGDWDDAAGRWIVRLENGEQKSLKPENLTVEEDMSDDTVSNLRMAADEESGFVSCCSSEAARQALASDQQRLEFCGIADAEERSRCVDLVIELLAAATGRKLQGISFVSCGLTAADFRRIAGALRSGVGPQVLAFGIVKNLGVELAAWRELFEALPPKVMWLDFGDNKLTDDAVAPLIKGLEGRDDLDKLFLDGNCLRSVSSLCDALPETGVTQLDLGDNDIDDAGAKKIAVLLPISVITILVVGSNPFTADGVKALFLILPRCSLDTLYLDNTGVDDECLQELAGVLKDASLTELHLDSTKITDAGVRAILPHLGESELTYFDISGNNVSEETTELLASSVSMQRDGEVEVELERTVGENETIEDMDEDDAEDDA